MKLTAIQGGKRVSNKVIMRDRGRGDGEIIH